jgi:FkbM family methyltransferase
MCQSRGHDVGSLQVEFWTSIICELLSGSHSFFPDNMDRIRFPGRVPLVRSIKDELLQLAASMRLSQHLFIDSSKVTQVLNVDGLPRTYGVFEDDDSRRLFVKLLAYRILGPRRVRLPSNSPEYWKKVEQAKRYVRKVNVVQDVPVLGSLDLYAFEDLELICHLMNVVNTFLLEQYRCDRAGVRVQPGDVVVDAGGGWGDTALYFAKQAQRVYSYECIPSNIALLKKNCDLNPQLAEKISLVSKALYKESGRTLNFEDTGPGSHRTREGFPVETDSIDNLVRTNSLPRVDFIKMDIEGGEMDALVGAEQTIRSYRPRLAISIYHSLQDFVRIPEWLASLDLGYKFYLDHFTIHEEETVLFAKAVPPTPHS